MTCTTRCLLAGTPSRQHSDVSGKQSNNMSEVISVVNIRLVWKMVSFPQDHKAIGQLDSEDRQFSISETRLTAFLLLISFMQPSLSSLESICNTHILFWFSGFLQDAKQLIRRIEVPHIDEILKSMSGLQTNMRVTFLESHPRSL